MTIRPGPTDRPVDSRRTFGVVNIDKPPGPSSHQVVSWIKDILDIDRAAHAGTLDPKVTGCLPVLLGDATRLAQALLIGPKTYVTVLELHDHPPATLEETVQSFTGDIFQKPPRKSAVSRRLRTREIYDLDILEQQDRRILLRIECESGTYIRKLCHDLGLALGVGGHMGDLRRIATTPFDDTDLISLHDLTDAVAYAEEGDNGQLGALLYPGERALTHLPSLTIAPSAAESVANGSPVYAPGIIGAEDVAQNELLVCETPDGSAVCLGRLVGDLEADAGIVVDLERVLV